MRHVALGREVEEYLRCETLVCGAGCRRASRVVAHELCAFGFPIQGARAVWELRRLQRALFASSDSEFYLGHKWMHNRWPRFVEVVPALELDQAHLRRGKERLPSAQHARTDLVPTPRPLVREALSSIKFLVYRLPRATLARGVRLRASGCRRTPCRQACSRQVGFSRVSACSGQSQVALSSSCGLGLRWGPVALAGSSVSSDQSSAPDQACIDCSLSPQETKRRPADEQNGRFYGKEAEANCSTCVLLALLAFWAGTLKKRSRCGHGGARSSSVGVSVGRSHRAHLLSRPRIRTYSGLARGRLQQGLLAGRDLGLDRVRRALTCRASLVAGRPLRCARGSLTERSRQGCQCVSETPTGAPMLVLPIARCVVTAYLVWERVRLD